MRVAGIILAGGASRRFGTDKAAALLDGRPLIAHVATRLAPQVTAVAIVGARQTYGLPYPLIDDDQHEGKGPLAGIAAGLAWARTLNAHWLLTAPCDVPHLPHNLLSLLLDSAADGPSMPAMPATVETPRGIEAACSLWPVSMRDSLDERLAGNGSFALVAALEAHHARYVRVTDADIDGSFANINTRDDLAGLS